VTTVPTALPSAFSTLYRERWFTTAGESAPIESSRAPAAAARSASTSTTIASTSFATAPTAPSRASTVAIVATAGVRASI